MRKKKSLFIIFILILSFIIIFPNMTMAIGDPINDPSAYKPGSINASDSNAVAKKGGIIFNALSTIGVIIAVITVIVIGIKYMVGSVEEKAEYKKTMIPYLIGIVMIVGVSAILQLIAKIATNIE